MTTTRRLLHALLAAALLAALPAQAAVSGVMTYSGFLKSAAGAPVTTSTNITFRLYTTSSGGTSIWNDTVSVTPGADGWFSAPLGVLTPLLPAMMSQDLYLSLQVGTDTEFTQRARVTPSGSALAVDWSGVQGKPFCAGGQYLTHDATTGTLDCTTPPAGTGGLTSVLTAAPLSGTGLSGSAVTLTPCPTGQILQSSGSSWSCVASPTFSGTVNAPLFVGSLSGNASSATSASSAGTATTATTAGTANAVIGGSIKPSSLAGTVGGTGQVPSKTSAADAWTWVSPMAGPATACGAGQVLTWNGSALSCVTDFANGTITSVTAGAGLSGGTVSSGPAALTVNFAGSGVATTVARSDHAHPIRQAVSLSDLAKGAGVTLTPTAIGTGSFVNQLAAIVPANLAVTALSGAVPMPISTNPVLHVIFQNPTAAAQTYSFFAASSGIIAGGTLPTSRWSNSPLSVTIPAGGTVAVDWTLNATVVPSSLMASAGDLIWFSIGAASATSPAYNVLGVQLIF